MNILKSLSRLFRNEPVRVVSATNAREALAILERESIQVVVSDQRLPGMPGVAFLSEVRERYPDTLRILLTGFSEIDVAVDAINRCEVFRLLTKPWDDDELRATVRQALDSQYMRAEIKRLNEITREQNRTLELKVERRTREVQEKNLELRKAYVSTVRALAEAVDAIDNYTRGHSERVGVYGSRIAQELGCQNTEIERIYLGGLLHDIGKIGIPDSIICKPDKLTETEREIMRDHPLIGARILEPVGFLSDVVPCVRHHHEWYDGSKRGYPDRLSGQEIPFASRIILVADTIEAMTSDRPYRRALPLETVIDEIQRFTGTQFDPTVAAAVLTLIEREEERFLEHASKFDIESLMSVSENS
ncbi:MAG: HD domain-containing protein [bacterium]|nr:HD domain-containing protein [bacterium]